MRLHRVIAGVTLAGSVVLGGAGSAWAHDCFNTQRSGTGGVVGTFDPATGEFTPTGQPGNGAFVQVALPDGTVAYVFAHSGGEKHDYVVPGAKNCDGKGLDKFEACTG
jgi:hypothetical protein